MKKSLIALASMSALAGSALAQSSVTLYGVVDTSLRYTKTEGQASLKSMASGAMSGSRVGLRGTEDLGSGLQAGFVIESDLFVDSGTADAAKFWGRRATVSLIHKTLGEVRLGRDYVPTFDLQQPAFDPFGNSGIGAVGNIWFSLPSRLGSGSSAWVRADNMVKYVLPSNLGGVFGQFAVSASEGAAGNTNKHEGGVLGYASGPVRTTIGFGNTTDTAGTDKLKLTNITGSYDFGVLKLMAQYQTHKYKTRRQKSMEVATTIPFAGGTIKASYVRADQSGAGTDANDAVQFALGYVYPLSKRTNLYTTAVRLDNKGAQAFGIGPNATGGVAGKDIRGLEFGINHAF